MDSNSLSKLRSSYAFTQRTVLHLWQQCWWSEYPETWRLHVACSLSPTHLQCSDSIPVTSSTIRLLALLALPILLVPSTPPQTQVEKGFYYPHTLAAFVATSTKFHGSELQVMPEVKVVEAWCWRWAQARRKRRLVVCSMFMKNWEGCSKNEVFIGDFERCDWWLSICSYSQKKMPGMFGITDRLRCEPRWSQC